MSVPCPAFPVRLARLIDRVLERLMTFAMLLVLPLALLLCGQWPLRELLQAYSREANDAAQLLFGVYASMAITQATRSRAHLTPDVFARRYRAGLRLAVQRVATIACVLPWTGFILYTAVPMTWQSVWQLERFPDTFHPAYFILKLAVCLLATLVMLQAMLDLLLPVPTVRTQA